VLQLIRLIRLAHKRANRIGRCENERVSQCTYVNRGRKRSKDTSNFLRR